MSSKLNYIAAAAESNINLFSGLVAYILHNKGTGRGYWYKLD